MSYKTIEIYYDIASIPGIDPKTIDPTHALDFRNEAMEFIEKALEDAELGSWVGAEIGMGEVNFGFEVNDIEKAEKLVRRVVQDTRFANIREITQYESDDEFEPDDDDALDRDGIEEALRELGLESAEELSMTAAICHRMLPTSTVDETDRNDDEQSRFGGVPDVPESFEWPRRSGDPLAFLAQIDFWKEGERLLFFYDVARAPTGYSPSDHGSGHVLMVANENLKPAEPPRDLPDDCRFREVKMTMYSDIVLPDFKSNILREMKLPEKDLRRLEELDNEPNENDCASHHLMGHPTLVTEDMELAVQLASNGLDGNDPKSKNDPRFQALGEGADEWVLLFQCESDPLPGWNWGNTGRLFFWIQADDFNRRNFDNVWVMRQTKPG